MKKSANEGKQSIRKIPFEYDYIILYWSMKKDTVNFFSLFLVIRELWHEWV